MAVSTTVSKRTLFEDARLSVERRSLDGLKRILTENACLPFLLDDEQKSDLLAGAVINGDVAVAEFLILMFGADPGANNNWAIGYACEKGDLAMIRCLIPMPGVDPGANRNRAIQLACASGNLEVVKLMLTFPSVDVSASENMAFRLAAAAGHLHIVDMLLTLPEVNPHDSNNYALRRAAARGHFSIVDRILSLSTFDMDRAVIDEALILAAKHNHTDVVERLVRAGGSVSEENALALRLACAGGHIDVVKDLLSIGKFTMAVVYECIRKAVQNGQLAVFDMLSEAPGIDLSFNDNCLIKLAVACGHVGIARRILADPDVHPGADGNECVIRAASNGSVEMLELLLSHPLVDCTDQDHQAFVEAAGNGHVACLKTLMDRVEPIASDALWVEAALAQAARHGHVDIVQMIVDRVGDVVKQSALIAACQHNQLDAIALLSGMCATADACYSALDAAIASGNFDAAHMLLKVPGLSDYIPTALVQATSDGNAMSLAFFMDAGIGIKEIASCCLLNCARVGQALVVDRIFRMAGGDVFPRAVEETFAAALRADQGAVVAILIKRFAGRLQRLPMYITSVASNDATYRQACRHLAHERVHALRCALLVRRADMGGIPGKIRMRILLMAFWDILNGDVWTHKVDDIVHVFQRVDETTRLSIAFTSLERMSLSLSGMSRRRLTKKPSITQMGNGHAPHGSTKAPARNTSLMTVSSGDVSEFSRTAA
ncbi:unnamed protein product (mitochondrion) [Plasmodiophora brassicae]|uniref:Uncharacterized protein n=1 Tax=Plasmodiophora brassicae TaxID=37360 RepID=A0A0G4J1F5_PLABS|nr:hypothetical protein PBRA_002084 [Plasmodiophora brassicae]SPQ93241.1 unnamed protein product [Plasmodiophora brassicae]